MQGIAFVTYLCPDSTFAQLPSSTFQRRTVLSPLPDASSFPSGLQATARTSHLPFSVTYATVSYAHAPDRSVDVGVAVPPATAMHITEKRGWGAHEWPRRVCLHWPSSGFHMRTVLSLLDDARRLPSGLQATDHTGPLPRSLYM